MAKMNRRQHRKAVKRTQKVGRKSTRRQIRKAYKSYKRS